MTVPLFIALSYALTSCPARKYKPPLSPAARGGWDNPAPPAHNTPSLNLHLNIFEVFFGYAKFTQDILIRNQVGFIEVRQTSTGFKEKGVGGSRAELLR